MRLYQKISCYIPFALGLASLVSGCEEDKIKDASNVSYFASVPTGGTGMTLATGDFNEDGHLDLIVGATDGSLISKGRLYLFLGDGKGNFRRVEQTAEKPLENK